jgi:hypothetical protein
MRLNIYTENPKQESLKNIPLAPIVSPFIANEEKISRIYSWHLTFKHYWKTYREIFEFSSFADSQFAIFPYDWFWVRSSNWHYPVNSLVSKEVKKLSLEFYQKTKEKNKIVVLFFSGDRSHEKLPFKDVVVFREGQYKSQQKYSDFSLPAFSEDLVEHYLSGSIISRSKTVKPTVGFCGLAIQSNWKNWVKLGAYHSLMLLTTGTPDVSPYKGENMRVKLLKKLRASSDIETNFLIRDRSVFLLKGYEQTKLERRKEYVNNLLESDYILCCRGSGNYSYRIYETLCMGRIPIFVNTNCSLPYEFLIDWKNYCVWIEEHEIEQISSKVLDFHNSLSSQDFVDLQYKCRELWVKWLSPEGFFSNFYRHFYR